MSSSGIRMDEWLGELERLMVNEPDGFTVREAVRATPHGEKWVRDKLRDAIDAGLVRCVGRKRSTGIDGRPIYSPCYAVVEKKASKRSRK